MIFPKRHVYSNMKIDNIFKQAYFTSNIYKAAYCTTLPLSTYFANVNSLVLDDDLDFLIKILDTYSLAMMSYHLKL